MMVQSHRHFSPPRLDRPLRHRNMRLRPLSEPRPPARQHSVPSLRARRKPLRLPSVLARVCRCEEHIIATINSTRIFSIVMHFPSRNKHKRKFCVEYPRDIFAMFAKQIVNTSVLNHPYFVRLLFSSQCRSLIPRTHLPPPCYRHCPQTKHRNAPNTSIKRASRVPRTACGRRSKQNSVPL